MRLPAISIAWEVWNRNQWGSVLVWSAIPVCYVWHLLAPAGPLRDTLAIFEVLAMLFAIAIIFWLHSYADTDKQGKHAGYPARLYALPLSTARLVTWPMLFGSAAVVAFYLAWSLLIFPQWGAEVSWTWLKCHLLALAAMMASLQAILWSFHRFPWIRFILLSVVLIGLGAFGIMMPAHNFPSLGETGTVACLLSILPVAYFGAFLGVAWDRRGEWEGRAGRWRQKILDALPRRQEKFGSVSQAQLWFEWRRKGIFLAAMLALPCAATLMVFPVPAALYLEPGQAWLIYSSLPIMAALAAATVGVGLAKSDYWRRDLALVPFLATRPVRTGDLVVAKMKAAALIILLGALVFLILGWAAFHLLYWIGGAGDANFPSWSRFKEQSAELIGLASHPLIILTGLMLAWQAMMAGMSAGLSGRWRVVMVTGWIGPAMLIGLVVAGISVVKNPGLASSWQPLLPWLAGLLLLNKLAATFWAARQVAFRGYHSQTQVWWLATIWLSLAACVIASAFYVAGRGVAPEGVIFFGIAWLFPGRAIFQCAIRLASNRHR